MTPSRLLHRIVLFPFLLPVFFVLHISRYYYGAVPAGDALLMIGIYLLLAAVVYIPLRAALRRKAEASMLSLLLVGMYLYWKELIQYLLRALHLGPDFHNYPIVLAVCILLAILLCWLLRKAAEHTVSKVYFYLNVLFLLFIAIEIGYLGYYAAGDRSVKPLMAMNPAERQMDTSLKAGGNIYLLIFDEYASSRSLMEDWGIDNSGIDSFLRDRRFFINGHSRSNYNMTYFSMAALLHMDYFTGFRQPQNATDLPDYQQCAVAIEHARLPRILDQAGYAVKNYSVFDVAPGEQKVPVGYINSKRKLITINTFYDVLLREYLPHFRYKWYGRKDPAYREPEFYKMDDYNNRVVEGVTREARQQAGSPQFVYAHFMMPHPPYFYDSSGRIMSIDRIRSIDSSTSPTYYGYNVRHANSRLRQMVDAIQRYDPRAAIVVLGDHGYRLRTGPGPHPEYFRNMSAVYFPDGDYSAIPEGMTNVNVFRVVLNKVCGARYPLLEDRCYLLTEPLP